MVYDSNSLIADVGGYMGLLLGTSAIGFYKFVTPLILRWVWRAAKGKHHSSIVKPQLRV